MINDQLPKHRVNIKAHKEESKGFLKSKGKVVTFEYENGETKDMEVDYLHRNNYDAVCVLAYYKDGDDYRVYLRSCFRPPLACRDYNDSVRPERDNVEMQWELPAGLIERGETVEQSGARELEEEVGIAVDPKSMRMLRHRVFTSTGISGERIFFVYVEVDPTTKGTPIEDGSPMEKYGTTIAPTMFELNQAIANGHIIDGKTVMGIEAFQKLYGL